MTANDDEQIQFSQEDWDKFYESSGSRFFQLESTTLHAHGEDQKKLLYELFGSSKTLVQTIGVVAGFGFTGLGYVRNLPLFLCGEAFLLIAIFAGLYWTQHAYRSNLKSSTDEVVRLKGIFANRYAVFKQIYDKALSDIAGGGEILIPKSQMLELQKQNNVLLEKFSTHEERGDMRDPLGYLMVFFAIGGVLLLLSFTHICFWLP